MIGLIVLAVLGVGYFVVAKDPIEKCSSMFHDLREPHKESLREKIFGD